MSSVSSAVPLSHAPHSSTVVAMPVMPPPPLPEGQPSSANPQIENLAFGYTEHVRHQTYAETTRLMMHVRVRILTMRVPPPPQLLVCRFRL